MRRIHLRRDESTAEAVAAAVAVLRAGGIVAYPTDTLYGLAVDPRRADAVETLFTIKGRQQTSAIPLIAGNVEQAREAGTFGPREVTLAAAFWPGPLSIVVAGGPDVTAAVLAGDGTVAIRVPDHALARALAVASGFAITATSANLSGVPPAVTADEVAAALQDRIDLLLDAGPSPGGPPSTIVDLRSGSPVLVRVGAVEWDRVLKSLQ